MLVILQKSRPTVTYSIQGGGGVVRLTEPSVGLSVPICNKALPLPYRMFTNIIDQRAENIKRHFSFLCLAFLSTEWEEVFLVVEQFFFPVLGPRCCALAFSSRGERGLLSSCGARASHCGGFSCRRAQALGLSNFGTRA